MISVCLCTVRAGTVGDTIRSIIDQRYQDWELLVVAQGDAPRLRAEVARWADVDGRVRLVQTEQLGKSRGINAAARAARGDILAITDDDCQAAPDWLAVIAACFRARGDVGLVAGDLVAPAARPGISTCPATYTLECVYEPAASEGGAPAGFYWGGANVAIRRSAFALVGGFDEYLGPGTSFPSSEDADFGFRAEAFGVTMWTTPTAVVYHTHGRRRGLANVLRHYRNYALGTGALTGKHELWGHRLARRPASRAPAADALKRWLRHPARQALARYAARFLEIGKRQYLAAFDLDDRYRSVPKEREPQGAAAAPIGGAAR